MITINRRRCFNNIIQDYIQDGLICHLVGDDALTNKWTDRINAKVISLYNAAKTDDNKGVIFDGTSTYGTSGSIGSVSSCTLEIVANIPKSNTTHFLISQPSGYVNTILSFDANNSGNGHIYILTGAESPGYYGYLSGLKTLTITRNKAYINGSQISTKNASTYSNVAQSLVIGRRSINLAQYFKGTLYQIRIYDRVLTAEEVLINYNLDSKLYK